MFAYGLVAALGVQLARKNLPLGISESYGRLILLGSTTSMAAASAYFLYILITKFSGTSCSYCLTSALLSFSLFFITLKVCFLRPVFPLYVAAGLLKSCCHWVHKYDLDICRILGWKNCERWLVYRYV